MPDIRYDQYCPLTRAAEIVGERWTLLILRELFLGPKRFSDLKGAVNGISTSVLAERLARLEERGLATRRELPAPAASTVYELAEPGRALKPVLVELTRWGLRFLETPCDGDCVRAEWLVLGLDVFARRGPSQSHGARLRIQGDNELVEVYVRGGDRGTVVSRNPLPFDATLTAPALVMLGFASGALDLAAVRNHEGVACDGDLAVLERIPSLFEFRPTPSPAPAS